MNTRVSASSSAARKRALANRLTRAIIDRHLEGAGDELSRYWGADNAHHPLGLPDLARLLAISGQGVPQATRMSEVQIAASIAKGVDPWAIAVDGIRARQTIHPPLTDLLCAIRLAELIPDIDPNIGPCPPGVTALRIPDDGQRERIDTALAFVLPFLWEATTATDMELDEYIERLAYPSHSESTRASLHERFREKMDDALAKGLGILALVADISELSDTGQMLLVRDLTWPRFDRDAVIALLRATHTETGELAERDVRALLPDDAHLHAMPWPVVVHAFHADTTLKVADRLAAARLPEIVLDLRTLDDVQGLPDVTGHLRNLVSDVAAWNAGNLDWADVSASILLHGPPGVGKTMIAEALAGSASATFVATSYADCQAAGHLGNYLKEMQTKVAAAISDTPAVFFLDELDSYRTRGGLRDREDRYMHSVVNGLLTQLSRLNDSPGVIVVGATNHVDVIDPALIRAGRFDRKVAIGLPDEDGRAAILSGHLGDPCFDLGDLPLRLSGLTGADIAAIARDAKGIARQARRDLMYSHVEAAVNRRVPDPDENLLRRKAYHEAGHAVVAHVLGLAPASRVYIGPGGGGIEAPRPKVLIHETAIHELTALLAGRAAETVALGVPSTGAGGDEQSDLAIATTVALDIETRWGLGETLLHAPIMATDRHRLPDALAQKVEQRLRKAEERACSLLHDHRETLERLANALFHRRDLDERDIRDLLNPQDNPVPEAS